MPRWKNSPNLVGVTAGEELILAAWPLSTLLWPQGQCLCGEPASLHLPKRTPQVGGRPGSRGKALPRCGHNCRRRRAQSDCSSSVGGMKPLENLTNVMNLLPRKTRILMQTQKSTNKFRAPGHNLPFILHRT